MWNSLSELKSSITAIASDVMDTAADLDSDDEQDDAEREIFALKSKLAQQKIRNAGPSAEIVGNNRDHSKQQTHQPQLSSWSQNGVRKAGEPAHAEFSLNDALPAPVGFDSLLSPSSSLPPPPPAAAAPLMATPREQLAPASSISPHCSSTAQSPLQHRVDELEQQVQVLESAKLEAQDQARTLQMTHQEQIQELRKQFALDLQSESRKASSVCAALPPELAHSIHQLQEVLSDDPLWAATLRAAAAKQSGQAQSDEGSAGALVVQYCCTQLSERTMQLKASQEAEIKLRQDLQTITTKHDQLLTDQESRLHEGVQEAVMSLADKLEKREAECYSLRQQLKQQVESPPSTSSQQTPTSASASQSTPGGCQVEACGDPQDKEVQDLKADLQRLLLERNQARGQVITLQSEVGKLTGELDKSKKDVAKIRQHLLERSMVEEEATEAQVDHVRQLHEEELQVLKSEVCSTKTECEGLRSCLRIKEEEIGNLQTALGTFQATVEQAERNQREAAVGREALRHAQSQVEALGRDLEAERGLKSAAQGEAQEAKERQRQMKIQSDRLAEQASRMRLALEQHMLKMQRLNSDNDMMVDKRIVVKLLVTFYERGQSADVMNLMANMLQFTEEDKHKVGLNPDGSFNPGKGGVLHGLVGVPRRLVSGLGGVAKGAANVVGAGQDKDSIADMWVDFLIKHAEAEGGDGDMSEMRKAESLRQIQQTFFPSDHEKITHVVEPHVGTSSLSTSSSLLMHPSPSTSRNDFEQDNKFFKSVASGDASHLVSSSSEQPQSLEILPTTLLQGTANSSPLHVVSLND